MGIRPYLLLKVDCLCEYGRWLLVGMVGNGREVGDVDKGVVGGTGVESEEFGGEETAVFSFLSHLKALTR